MFYKIHIRQYERGLKFRRGDFVRPLAPGTHVIPIWHWTQDRIEVIDTTKTIFEHPMLDVLLRDPQLRQLLTIVDNTDNQRALVWKDERLFHILGPGRFAYW